MKHSIIVLIVIFLFSIGAATASDVEDKIENLNKQQDEIKDDIDHLNDQLLMTKNELEKIDAQLIDKIKEVELVEKQLEDTRNELREASDELSRTIAQAQEHENMMAKRVRVMFMNRINSYLELLLRSESINELLVRLELIRNVVSFDQRVVDELQLYRAKIDAQKVKLEDKEWEITTLAETARNQKLKIEQTKYERSKILVKLENQLDELESTSKQIERKIQDLIRQQNELNRRATFTGGVMQWPVPGFYRVTSPFGYRVHPIFGTRRMHAGIDVGANITDRGRRGRQSIYGRNFVAAADGVVIFAGRFGGYGNTVIIDHGGDITTLYAHGARILVSEGIRVDRGDPVMTVGSTGVSTGAHAHFEVRVNGTPVDPMPYLRGR